MPNLKRIPARRIIPALLTPLCAIALSASPAAAEERWYQISVAIFERSQADEENWRRNLELRYPDQPQALMNREEYLAEHCLPRPPEPTTLPMGPADLPVPAFPAQRIHDRALETLWRLSGNAACLPLLAGEWTVAYEEDERSIRRPIPFTLLDSGDRELEQAASRLSGSAGYRVLFKGSWHQPLKRDAPPTSVLIRGGDRFGEHRELEGYVQLALRRYLHLDTDLWLSRFTRVDEGDEQQPQFTAWPTLPTDPLRGGTSRPPADRMRDQGDTDTAALGMAQNTAAAVMGESPPQRRTAQRNGTRPIEPRNDHETGRAQETAAPSPIDAYDGHRIERLVTLRQQRRMRSNQLHYIDHPLFGLLIKITPVEVEEDG